MKLGWFAFVMVAALGACGGVSTSSDGGAGTTGTAGATGSAGTTGAAGSAGSTGTAGDGGTTGHAGSTGSAGAAGATAGSTGAAGHAGSTGAAGSTAGSTGTAGAGGSPGGACFDTACNGTCMGTSCTTAWTCDTTAQICTADIADYCGCDGQTFQASSSCPTHAFAHRGACTTTVSCDPRAILCKVAAPTCPTGQVPSVKGICYGPCVPVEMCECGSAAACPDPGQYTCHMSAGHCGPYVN